MRRAGIDVLRVLAAFATLIGCGRSAPSGDTTAPVTFAPVAPTAVADKPVDHLAPGELVEGAQQAFGIPLPRELKVESTFPDVVYASGPVSVHSLVQYFRAHLQDGGVREGAEAASFDHVKVNGKPGLELAIQIRVLGPGTHVEIHDATPPPAPNLPDEAARWRQVGLTPDGKIMNPKHLD